LKQRKYTYVSKRGNSLLVREVGEVPKVVKNYNYSLYEPTKNPTKFISWNSKHNLEEVGFETIGQMKDYIDSYGEISNFPIFGQPNPIYQYISNEYTVEESNVKDYFIMSLDIETERHPVRGYAPSSDPFAAILTIQIQDFRNSRFIVYGYNKNYTPHPDQIKAGYNVEYICADDEREMLLNFIEYWSKTPPEVVTGWNIDHYDIPYITNRITNYVFQDRPEIVLALSPFRTIYPKTSRDAWGNDVQTYIWTGVVSLDYLPLYKKFTYGARESYKLDSIAALELGDKKVDYSEFENLQDLYNRDFSKFVYYGCKDDEIVQRLDKKLQFINLAFTLAYRIKCNIDDVFSPTRAWAIFIDTELKKKNMIVPLKKTESPHFSIMGGYVQDIEGAVYEWCSAFDLNSLYPHIQMELNISPEKLIEDKDLPEELLTLRESLGSSVEGIERLLKKDIDTSCLKKYNVSMAPNGMFYKNDSEGFIPAILKAVYAERKAAKNEMLELKKELEALKHS
jgi:DNA polymerase elongation subunit (family B)